MMSEPSGKPGNYRDQKEKSKEEDRDCASSGLESRNSYVNYRGGGYSGGGYYQTYPGQFGLMGGEETLFGMRMDAPPPPVPQQLHNSLHSVQYPRPPAVNGPSGDCLPQPYTLFDAYPWSQPPHFMFASDSNNRSSNSRNPNYAPPPQSQRQLHPPDFFTPNFFANEPRRQHHQQYSVAAERELSNLTISSLQKSASCETSSPTKVASVVEPVEELFRNFGTNGGNGGGGNKEQVPKAREIFPVQSVYYS